MLKITEEPNKDTFLQSRIDQQIELICILKQRADQYLLKYQHCEKQAQNLEKHLQDSRRRNTFLHNKCTLLEKNISQLEHHQLSLQNQCETFKKENLSSKAKLKVLDQERNEKEDRILSLQKDLEDIPNTQKAKIAELEKKLANQLTSSENQQENDRKLLQKEREKNKELKQSLKVHVDELNSVKIQWKDLEGDFLHETEEKQILQNQLISVEQTLQKAQNHFRNLKSISEEEGEKNKTEMAKLKRAYDELHHQLPSTVLEKERQVMKQDLHAYKEHAKKLLSKEQELNAKLRRFNPKKKEGK